MNFLKSARKKKIEKAPKLKPEKTKKEEKSSETPLKKQKVEKSKDGLFIYSLPHEIASKETSKTPSTPPITLSSILAPSTPPSSSATPTPSKLGNFATPKSRSGNVKLGSRPGLGVMHLLFFSSNR